MPPSDAASQTCFEVSGPSRSPLFRLMAARRTGALRWQYRGAPRHSLYAQIDWQDSLKVFRLHVLLIRMKKWLIVAVILGAGFGAYSVWSKWQTDKLATALPDRPTTATVELRNINFAVNAAGEIGPAE